MKSDFLKTLEDLECKAKSGPLTLGQIFDELGGQGHLILILFLILPFLQPIPLPGLSTPMGLMIWLVATFKYWNKPPWLPKRFRDRPLSRDLLLNILRAAEKAWSYIEKVLEPRWYFCFQNPFFKVFNTLVICVQALLLCLPLPIPFSNNIPALVILVNVIGELEEDGLVILFSYILFIVSLIFFSMLAFGLGTGLEVISKF